MKMLNTRIDMQVYAYLMLASLDSSGLKYASIPPIHRGLTILNNNTHIPFYIITRLKILNMLCKYTLAVKIYLFMVMFLMVLLKLRLFSYFL